MLMVAPTVVEVARLVTVKLGDEQTQHVWYVCINNVMTEVLREPGDAAPLTMDQAQAQRLGVLLKATATKAFELGAASVK
jgi:hypothetical protein